MTEMIDVTDSNECADVAGGCLALTCMPLVPWWLFTTFGDYNNGSV